MYITGYQSNANQNHIEIPSHASQNGDHSKNLETTDAGEDVEKKEHFYTVGGSVNQFNHGGRRCGDSSRPQKQKFHLTQQSRHWVYTQRTINRSILKTHAHSCSSRHCLKQQRARTNPNAVIDWTRKMWHICTMEYYAATKKQ